MEKEHQLGHYPFEKGEPVTKVHVEFGRHITRLLDLPIFQYQNREKIFEFLSAHFQKAESLFIPEEEARKRGDPNANLFYHGKEHAVYQAGYDGITVAYAVLEQSKIAKYMTPDGVVATVVGAIHHDNGYVYTKDNSCNFASRKPIHVKESMRSANNFLAEIKPPNGLSSIRIGKFVKIGIHATNFPFTGINREERKEMIKDLDPKEKKEALIVALCVQLADLGGQVARRDYLNNLKDLRKELNCEAESLGDQIIGKDEEMLEKCKGFIENVVKTSVGKTAKAFFCSDNNTFSVEWLKHTKD